MTAAPGAVEAVGGREIAAPLAGFSRLQKAARAQRSKWRLTGGGSAFTGKSWLKTFRFRRCS